MKTHVNVTDKFVVVGDRVLLRPGRDSDKTESGLYLPPGVHEKEKIRSAFVLKTGPGYAVAPPADPDEPWKEPDAAPKYIPLQAREGDLAIYLQSHAQEIEFEKEKYVIVPHSAILVLIREDDLG
ncbi:MAG: co-chaperone GroES [Balneolaceae bacterium]|nr:MAG: co-chaperone GroES [Balneolaceae bacterium]